MNQIKWLAEYSFIESFYYDSGDVENILHSGHCAFSCNSDTYSEAFEYAKNNILSKIIELETSCKYSKSEVSKFEIDDLLHLIEF